MSQSRPWLVEYRGDLSQEQVAKKANISRGAYSNIEIGKRDPSVHLAKALAGVLGFEWTIFFENVVVEMKENEKVS